MPNYKCITEFKSKHGKVWKVGEMVGEKWYECMEPNEKANFEFLNEFADMPPRAPGIITVPMDEEGSGEPYFIGFDKEKARQQAQSKEDYIQKQVEEIKRRQQNT